MYFLVQIFKNISSSSQIILVKYSFAHFHGIRRGSKHHQILYAMDLPCNKIIAVGASHAPNQLIIHQSQLHPAPPFHPYNNRADKIHFSQTGETSNTANLTLSAHIYTLPDSNGYSPHAVKIHIIPNQLLPNLS